MREEIYQALTTSNRGSVGSAPSSVGFRREFTDRYSIPLRQVRFIRTELVVARARELVSSVLQDLQLSEATTTQEFLQGIERIFSHPEVMVGDREILEKNLMVEREALERCFLDRRPLTCTISGFPYKMRNPLYTVAEEPDMAEVLALTKLSGFVDSVQKLYAPGAQVTILAENSILAPLADVPLAVHTHYLRSLQHWLSLIDTSRRVLVRDLADYHAKDFYLQWQSSQEELEGLFEVQDAETVERVGAVLPGIFKTLDYTSWNEDLLWAFFNPDYRDPALEQLRERQYDRAVQEACRYLAYQEVRLRSNFMNTVFPGALKLGTFAKAGVLGFNLLNASSTMLPYFGYIVDINGSFEMRYRVDVPENAQAVYLEGGCTRSPFYFVME
jgi:pyoverdine/dityrosine biosynthesis protein Dit1